jgi:MFS family permease
MNIAASDRGTTEWRVRIVLVLSTLLASLGTTIANIALPNLAEAFAAPFASVQWIVVAYLATLTASTLLAGRLGDVLGLRRIHLVGVVTFGLTSLVCGLAPNLWLLVCARAVQGVGAAFLMTIAMALMRETAREQKLGRAMGLLGTASALGTVLGPSLGGVLLSMAGWRGIFLVQVPMTMLVLGLAVLWLPRSAAKPITSSTVRASLNTSMLPNLIVNFLVAAVMMATLVVGPFYLSLGLGLTEAAIGLVMSLGPLISVFGGVAAGRAVDRWGAPPCLAIGLTLLATGALLLSVLPGALGVGGYVLSIVVLTPGYQLFQAANNTAALAKIAKDQRGLASGLLTFARNIGLIAGTSMMGAVFALGVGTSDFRHASPAAIDRGLCLTSMIAAGMMVAALAIASGPSLLAALRRAELGLLRN